jgi:hypothetical protein
MPEDAGANGPAPWVEPQWPHTRVREMQAKLHRWAAADPGRSFDDLYNLVCDPAFLLIGWERVAGNTGARTAGVDRYTVREITERVGVEAFLADIRHRLKARTFRPLPVRERMIPKPGGRLRKLGIPTVADRVVQAALKLVLEPIVEADFEPVCVNERSALPLTCDSAMTCKTAAQLSAVQRRSWERPAAPSLLPLLVTCPVCSPSIHRRPVARRRRLVTTRVAAPDAIAPLRKIIASADIVDQTSTP